MSDKTGGTTQLGKKAGAVVGVKRCWLLDKDIHKMQREEAFEWKNEQNRGGEITRAGGERGAGKQERGGVDVSTQQVV